MSGVLVGCLYLPNGNPRPRPQIRLQARLDGAPDRPRRGAGRARLPGRARRRLQRHPDRSRRLQARALAGRRPVPARAPRPISAPARRRAGPTPSAISTPDERIYTFWDYWRSAWERNAGIRIDHLLLNPVAARRLAAAGVDTAFRARPHASDHAPAWAVLREDRPIAARAPGPGRSARSSGRSARR